MADNKNQHFVPRCHLKPFTCDGAGRAIQVANLDRLTAIQNAPVRSQCSGPYFYGDDPRLEAAIQSIEGPYGEIVQDLLTAGGPVQPGHRIVLQRFILLQHCRTEAASRRAFEMTQAFLEIPGVELDDPPLNFRDAIRSAVIAAMQTYAQRMAMVDDLKVCLVRNRTGLPFVTSDDPAILTNRWHLQNRRTKGLSFGVKNAGALFSMPLSPEVHCLLYDGDVYTVGQAGGWIEARREADVASLNDHQALNCQANLYFRDWEGRARVLGALAAAAPRRPPARQEVHYAVKDVCDGDWTRYKVIPKAELREGVDTLVHVIPTRRVPDAWPSFLQYRRDGKAYSNGTRAGYVRRYCLEAGLVTGEGYRKIRL